MAKISKSTQPFHLEFEDGVLELEPELSGERRGKFLLSVADETASGGTEDWACVYVTVEQLEEMLVFAKEHM